MDLPSRTWTIVPNCGLLQQKASRGCPQELYKEDTSNERPALLGKASLHADEL